MIRLSIFFCISHSLLFLSNSVFCAAASSSAEAEVQTPQKEINIECLDGSVRFPVAFIPYSRLLKDIYENGFFDLEVSALPLKQWHCTELELMKEIIAVRTNSHEDSFDDVIERDEALKNRVTEFCMQLFELGDYLDCDRLIMQMLAAKCLRNYAEQALAEPKDQTRVQGEMPYRSFSCENQELVDDRQIAKQIMNAEVRDILRIRPEYRLCVRNEWLATVHDALLNCIEPKFIPISFSEDCPKGSGDEGGWFSPCGNYIVMSKRLSRYKLGIWDLRTRELIHSFAHMSDIVAFSQDGRYFAYGRSYAANALTGERKDSELYIYDMQQEKCLRVLVTKRIIHSIAFSPDGRHIATGSRDKTICIWNVHTGLQEHRLKGENEEGKIIYSPDGKYIISHSRYYAVNKDSTIRIWDIKSEKVVQVIEEHKKRIFSVAFSPDGKMLVSLSTDGLVCLWDMQSRQLIKKLNCNKCGLNKIGFSPDGNYVAIFSKKADQNMLKVCNINNEDDSLEFLSRDGEDEVKVMDIDFSPGGKYIVSVSLNGDIMISSYKGSVVKRNHVSIAHGSLRYVAYSANGRYLIIKNIDGEVSLLDLFGYDVTADIEAYPEFFYNVLLAWNAGIPHRVSADNPIYQDLISRSDFWRDPRLFSTGDTSAPESSSRPVSSSAAPASFQSEMPDLFPAVLVQSNHDIQDIVEQPIIEQPVMHALQPSLIRRYGPALAAGVVIGASIYALYRTFFSSP